METAIRTVHCTLPDQDRKILQEKMEKLKFAESMLLTAECVVTQEHNEYHIECKLHFRGRTSSVVKDKGYVLLEVIDSLMHKVTHKVSKEKDKRKTGY